MTKALKAKEIFINDNLNCAQSVFVTLAKNLDIESETALRIASSFGGGMKNAEVCGAVSGALMALGLRYNNGNTDDNALVYNKCKELTKLFKDMNQSIICKKLLGYDISTEKGKEEAKSKNLFKEKCPEFVKNAVDIYFKI